MMDQGIWILVGTAVFLGFFHTLIGPDHYLPFIAMAKARQWPLKKTLLIAFFSGLGHVLSSVVLGFIGLALGIAVSKLELAESWRGNAAAWLFIGFGFAYLVWGLHRAIKNKPHRHLHFHADGETHEHLHQHESDHVHVHERKEKANITPWVLFTIFVFGPCEPLIPLVMYPAARHSIPGVILVASTFAVATIATMLIIIALSSWGLRFVKLGPLERYAHALAGAAILLSGLAVQFLGL
ncbi:MAG: sulfite exporter TauE/SafE family protein [Candidatus Aminicenantes bacterium]|nr:sulfite exporter TauE/SafE family protein [Candidatus Aminicenantes bacterium]